MDRIVFKFHFFTQLTLFYTKNLQLWKLREKKSFVNNGTFFFFWNSKLHNGMGSLVKLASNKCVKTACFSIDSFIHYFKHYGQNIFWRTTVLYLIAKVERKDKTFYLKHEIILCQKEKRSKILQVKVIVKTSEKRLFLHSCFFSICGSLSSFV